MAKDSKITRITAYQIISWALVGIFGLMAISALVQWNPFAMFMMAAISMMWVPISDETAKEKGWIQMSGWAKFILMWIILAILSFGGFYR